MTKLSTPNLRAITINCFLTLIFRLKAPIFTRLLLSKQYGIIRFQYFVNYILHTCNINDINDINDNRGTAFSTSELYDIFSNVKEI